MNDRAALVERLAREAGIWMEPSSAPVRPSAKHNARLERFAALVAGECARLCEMTTEEGLRDMNCETKAYASAEAIRDRFGIGAGQ